MQGSSHFDDAGIIVDDETRWQRAQVSGTVQAAVSPPHAESADLEQAGSGAEGAGTATSLTTAVLTAAQRRAELQAELQRNIQDAMQVRCEDEQTYFIGLVEKPQATSVESCTSNNIGRVSG